MGIRSFIGRVFGAPEATKEIVTSVRDGLDALVYTEEEKANDASKERAEGRSILVQWMQATSGQNLARRFISLLITGIWVFQYMIAQLCAFAAIWIQEEILHKRMLASADLMAGYAEQMNGAVMLILGFYFAAPHLGLIADKAMDRFSKAPKST